MKKMFRLLSLVLCLAMLCGLAVGASAAEDEPVEMVETAVRNNEMMKVWYQNYGGEKGDHVYFIENFEDLALVAATAEHDLNLIIYDQPVPLVIEQSITIPSKCYLQIGGTAEAVIPAGVTLTTDVNGLYVNKLQVNGTLNCPYMNVGTSLTVNGTVNCEYSLMLEENATITNAQNVKFSNEWSTISVNYFIQDMADLKRGVAAAAAGMGNGYQYDLNVFDNPITITESITIPENCSLYFYDQPITVAKGATLTLEGWMGISNQLTVQGALVNNEGIGVYPEEGGKLVFENGGSYSGTGGITVGGQNMTSPDGAIVGLDMSIFDVWEDSEYGHYWYYNLKSCGDRPEDHVFGEWEIEEEPTCTETGMKVQWCKICGMGVGNEIEPLDHTWTDALDHNCNRCGEVRSVTLPEVGDSTPMYRLYNPNSGEHFYTKDVAEREMLITAGWTYEGVAWNAPTKSGAPVYRLYNPNAGEHHYTINAAERDMLVGVGWNDEGIGWLTAGDDQEPIYRVYNPNEFANNHHYTRDANERDWLVSLGWVDEGIGWYGVYTG